MIEKLIGILTILVGVSLFWGEFQKKTHSDMKVEELFGLTQKEIAWSRQNSLWRSFGLMVVGALLLIFGFN